MEPASDVAAPPAPRWGWFVLWAVLGLVATFGLLSFITPALVLGGIAILVAVWFAARIPAFGASAFGAIAGVGAMALVVAFLQRRGPGTVCWRTATASGCDDYLNPWPWLIVGLALIATGVVLQVRRMRSTT
jgi:hypothetical protein